MQLGMEIKERNQPNDAKQLKGSAGRIGDCHFLSSEKRIRVRVSVRVRFHSW
jgi:hypothetical protein